MAGPYTRRPDFDPTGIREWMAGRGVGTVGGPERRRELRSYPGSEMTLLSLPRAPRNALRPPRKIGRRKNYSKRTTRPISSRKPSPGRRTTAGTAGSPSRPCDRPRPGTVISLLLKGGSEGTGRERDLIDRAGLLQVCGCQHSHVFENFLPRCEACFIAGLVQFGTPEDRHLNRVVPVGSGALPLPDWHGALLRLASDGGTQRPLPHLPRSPREST
jgi:hypothetical protein